MMLYGTVGVGSKYVIELVRRTYLTTLLYGPDAV